MEESATGPGGGAARSGEGRRRWPRPQQRGQQSRTRPGPGRALGLGSERRAAATGPMAASGQLFLLYLSAVLLPRLGAAFNLDTREDNVIRKSGDPGSLFGFSLAMHWQLHPEDKRL